MKRDGKPKLYIIHPTPKGKKRKPICSPKMVNARLFQRGKKKRLKSEATLVKSSPVRVFLSLL